LSGEDDEALGLFEGFGIELEYMIVDAKTLDVAPVCDGLLHAASGSYESEIEQGELAWSNELVLHVVELKTNGPAPSLDGLAVDFGVGVERVDELLRPMAARLMPTAMHPWMNPERDARIWPHEYNAVYEAFDRIFDCNGHGWSNLQSAHINLPFSGDDEFGRLHAAIRMLLPILPALAASSPVVDGRANGILDNRLEYYRSNSRRIPAVTGRVIPERADSRSEYEEVILEPMYRAIAPHDPDGILQNEWLNARGAIARFDRDAIEIRVLDVQECPLADLAIARIVVSVLRDLIRERWVGLEELKAWPIGPLEGILLATARSAEDAVIEDSGYLAALGMSGTSSCRAGDVWRHLVEGSDASGLGSEEEARALETLVGRGSLARRIADALAAGRDLRGVYEELCECLIGGRLFGWS
jgi:glutamate---cysteine ligase / carboxylate-amine ligase